MLTQDDCRLIVRKRQLHYRDIKERYNIKISALENFFATFPKMSEKKKEDMCKLFEKIEKEIPVKLCKCRICGKEFVRPYMFGRRAKTVCSKECQKKFKKLLKEEFIKKHGGSHRHICKYCEKEFYCLSPNTWYCSKECKKKYKAEKKRKITVFWNNDNDHINDVLSVLEGRLY